MATVKKDKRERPHENVLMHFVVGDPNFPNGINYYTHGLPTLYDHPDLQICMPIQPSLAKGIFNAAIRRIAEGYVLSPGQAQDGIIAGFEVNILKAQEWDRPLIRLVLPDENGNFDTPYYKEQVTKLHPIPIAENNDHNNLTVMKGPKKEQKAFNFVMQNFEIRKVPAGWKHPRDDRGKYIPMFEEYYPDVLNKWWQQHLLWEDNKHPYQLEHPAEAQQLKFYAAFGGDPPSCDNYQTVKIAEEQKVCYQVYETVSQGTPISPVFEHIKFVRTWLEKSWGHTHLDAVKFCRDEMLRLGQNPDLVNDTFQEDNLQVPKSIEPPGKKPPMDPLSAAINAGLDDAHAIQRPIGGKLGRHGKKQRKRKNE